MTVRPVVAGRVLSAQGIFERPKLEASLEGTEGHGAFGTGGAGVCAAIHGAAEGPWGCSRMSHEEGGHEAGDKSRALLASGRLRFMLK